MARVVDADIQAIISDDVDGVVSDFSVFIANASIYMTQVEADHATFAALKEETLKLIETYIAAHMTILKTKFAKSEKAGSVGAGFAVQVGLGLDETWYGSSAKSFDTSGTLGRLDEEAKKGSKTRRGFGYVGEDFNDGISE